jgi:hypothetical protein
MKHLLLLIFWLLAGSAEAAVNVFVRDRNGRAELQYECTAGEVVRSFALDVSVDKGWIIGVTNYFRGPSTAQTKGYGIFPAAFRDRITVSSGTNANWEAPDYTPLAVVADNPGGTLAGLNSSGVTLEFGGLWDASDPASLPTAAGTLCWLEISEAAQVTVTTNASRGGVVSASTGASMAPVFTGATVDPAVIITGIALTNETVTVSFKGGELESAPAITGPWTETGNSSGTYTNTVSGTPVSYYRVHRH